MSNFILEILEPTTHIIEIDTSYIDNINNIEIERYETVNLELINTEKILVSDLPDNIPMSKISGNLSVNRIDGLSSYISTFLTNEGYSSEIHVDDLIWGISNVGLSGYLDQYTFDGGDPI